MKPLDLARIALALSLTTLAACSSETDTNTPSSSAIEVTSPAPNYTVEGAVGVHGQFPMDEDLTIFEAVFRAHPDTERCDLSQVELTRDEDGSPLAITIDVGHIADTGDSTYNIKVREGDSIFVPSK